MIIRNIDALFCLRISRLGITLQDRTKTVPTHGSSQKFDYYPAGACLPNMSNEPLVCFTNCHLTLHGELLQQDLYFSPATGLIATDDHCRADSVTRINLSGKIVAPGFLELQSNGMAGIHFTQLVNGEDDESRLQTVARMQIKSGVTGWWATIPTVAPLRWKEILPTLTPCSFASVGGADLLGAHVEGPFLNPSKKGAHNDAYFQQPTEMSPSQLYGVSNLQSIVRMVTVAPELPGSVAMIGALLEDYPHITVSLGHSSATYEDGIAAVDVGAKMLTHTFNAMAPMQHRSPGLAGLMAGGKVWYSESSVRARHDGLMKLSRYHSRRHPPPF